MEAQYKEFKAYWKYSWQFVEHTFRVYTYEYPDRDTPVVAYYVYTNGQWLSTDQDEIVMTLDRYRPLFINKISNKLRQEREYLKHCQANIKEYEDALRNI